MSLVAISCTLHRLGLDPNCLIAVNFGLLGSMWWAQATQLPLLNVNHNLSLTKFLNLAAGFMHGISVRGLGKGADEAPGRHADCDTGLLIRYNSATKKTPPASFGGSPQYKKAVTISSLLVTICPKLPRSSSPLAPFKNTPLCSLH